MNKETIGMYVRTKEGKIFKIDGDLIYLSYDKTILYRLITRIPHDATSYKVVKASFNIIDLIEVGDYVNGLPVQKINQYVDTQEKYFDLYGSCSDWENEDIKSVVTHEQMKQMSYKLGE